MIGKAKSISHVSNAINYAKNKIKAVEINRNKVIGETGKEIAKEFRVFQNLNSRCNRNSFSFVLSPSIEDGTKLVEIDFAKIARDFLTRMNLNQNQHISFLHKDKDHAHIHIFANRIDAKGKAFKDNYIGKKAQRIAEKIALDWNFTTARKVQQEKESRLAGQITKAHEMILRKKPKDIFEYAKLMKHFGIELHLKQASNDKVVGLKFQIGKESIKASSVHRSLSAANLQKTIQRNLKSHSIKL
jgi:hypothetical protein